MNSSNLLIFAMEYKVLQDLPYNHKVKMGVIVIHSKDNDFVSNF